MKSLAIAFFAFAIHAKAQIELKWEFRPDPVTFLGQNPQPDDPPTSGHEIYVDEYISSPSGYTLLKVEGRYMSQMEDTEKLVILNPDGGVEWISGNLGELFPENLGANVQLIHVGPGSAIAHVSQPPSPDSGTDGLLVYNKLATPQANFHRLSGEDFAKGFGDAMGNDPSDSYQTRGFTGTTFYTMEKVPNSSSWDSKYLSFRKYGLAVTSQPEIVIANASGLQDNNLVLRWQSAVGVRYQVQESTNLSVWTEVGSAIDGNGTELSWSQAVGSTPKFFRVVQR